MRAFNCVPRLQARVHFSAVLAIWLICGISSSAFAFQTDPTMTGYTPPPTGDPLLDPPPPPSSPPLAMDDWYQTSYGYSIYTDPLANDFAGSSPIDPSTLTIEFPPMHGTVQVDGITGMVEYTPNPGFAGTDQYFYSVSDINGNVSNIAMVDLMVINLPPNLFAFNVRQGPSNVWFFEGQVFDENPQTVTIIFGGLLEGDTTTVNADGTFSFAKFISQDDSGGVSAQARDELGSLSDVLYDEVFHY